MERMPHETLKEIFDFLDPIDLFSIAMVCKAWNKLSSEDKIWMKWKSDFKSQYFQWLKEQAAKFASGKPLDWIRSQGTKKPPMNVASLTNGKAYDYLLKLLLVGDSGVGKSSILLRFADDTFQTSFVTTLGIDFKIKSIELYGKRIKLQIWDTAGQERFRTITSAYYRGAHGILFIYDVSNRNSFENLKVWFKNAELNAHESVVKTLIGNKQDASLDRLEYAAEHGCHYFEVSAKTGENIHEAFMETVKEILPDLSPPPRPPSEQLFLERIKTIHVHHGHSKRDKKEKCIVS